MDFLRNKRAQEGGVSGTTVAIIIGLIVLAFAIIMIAQPRILDWIRQQPGYSSPADNYAVLTNDEKKALGYITLAVFNAPAKSGGDRPVSFVLNNNLKEIVITDFYLTHEKVQEQILYGDIYAHIPHWYAQDIKIGNVDADRVHITISETDYDKYKIKYPEANLASFADVKKYLDLDKNVGFELLKMTDTTTK